LFLRYKKSESELYVRINKISKKIMTDKDTTNSYKVVMLGDAGVGKTCIVNRYMKNSFTQVESTLGSNFSSKVLSVQPKGVLQPVKVKLQIWDTAGGEQFRSLTPIYYKNANAVCLVYDSTSSESFNSLQYWVDELQNQSGNNILICVVASKTDFSEAEEVPIKQANEYAKSIKATLF